MKQKRYSENTIGTYPSFVRQFFKKYPDRSWDAITKDLISRYNYEEFIAKRKAYSTQNQWINAIKIYLKVHALDVGELQDIERPRKEQRLPNILSKQGIKRILMSTKNTKHYLLLSIVYGAGLRLGEALQLKKSDVRTEEKLFYISKSKGMNDRRLPLTRRLREMYSHYCKVYEPKEFVFEGQKSGRYSASSARKVLKRACVRAKIDFPVTLHYK